MKTIVTVILTLGMCTIASVSAADVPMQCSLTCKSDYTTPAGMQTKAEPTTVDELLARQVMVADASMPFAPATAAVTGIPLSAEADSDTTNTGDFDFITECVQYQGKVWAWREGKCKSMSPDWKSPGLGNYVKH